MAQRDESREQTFLAPGMSIQGTVRLAGPTRIEGEVEGEVTAGDLLTIGETGVVRASIAGTTVIVHGQVQGDVSASVRLELHGTGRIHGSISAPTVVVHEGAVFHGMCSMGPSPATNGHDVVSPPPSFASTGAPGS